jgi:spoIIIJ-associated protein
MNTEKAKEIIENIFKLMGTPAESVSYSHNDKRGHIFSVKSVSFSEVSIFKTELNRDIVYLIKRIFDKQANTDTGFRCTIDINDQQSEADAKIKEKALAVAEEARSLKTDILMDPMSSYERMIVHSALSDQTDIGTESVGEGRDRRIKVKYLPV